MRAVIFDMDGVIVNSEPVHERAFLDVVGELGYGENHGIRSQDYIGRADRELWEEFVARHHPAQSLEELCAIKRKRVIEILQLEQPVFEGIPELVRKVADRVPIAVASGSERPVVEAVLALHNLGRSFSAVVTSSEVSQGKPAPEIFLRAAELLGVVPADCWVIEDSKPGILAGRAAGMTVIAITNSHSAAELRGAHYLVDSYAEIEELLLRRAPTA